MSSPYLNRYNTDNVHARAVIVGLVNLLNSKVQYENIFSNTEILPVTVPFYYNFGGDERFLQDYFLHWNECVIPQMVDGNVDQIPRGIVTLTASTINTNMLTNRFVRGNYVKQVGNEVLTYNSFINSIPLTMDFTVEITADSSLDAFKIQQSVLETFYKTQVFSVEFRGFRVPCQVGFPEDQGIEKTFEFTYQDDTKIGFNVPLQLETYYPVTDPTTERFSGNRMNYPGGPNLELTFDERYTLPRFTISSPQNAETFFSSGKLAIQWGNTGPITRVNLYYQIVGQTGWTPIAKNLQNTGFYVWTVPFLNQAGVEVAGESTKAFVNTSTGTGARLRAIIDSLGSVSSIVIFEGGYAYEGTDSIIVDDETATIVQPTISPSVINGGIIGYQIIGVGADFTPTPVNQIRIKVENANSEEVYQILEKKIQFNGNVSSGSDTITGISPDLTIPQNLIELGLAVGQTIEGAGIPIGTTIIAIDNILNTVQMSATANLTLVGGSIAGPSVEGSITIM
jgi:hypothetical protein